MGTISVAEWESRVYLISGGARPAIYGPDGRSHLEDPGMKTKFVLLFGDSFGLVLGISSKNEAKFMVIQDFLLRYLNDGIATPNEFPYGIPVG
jgi:hypothetical protein